MSTAEAESDERRAGRAAGVDGAGICGWKPVAAERLQERSGGSERLEEDERRRDDDPVKGDAAERQENRDNDKRDAGDGDSPARTGYVTIVCGFDKARWSAEPSRKPLHAFSH
jgi:hypothetical protein